MEQLWVDPAVLAGVVSSSFRQWMISKAPIAYWRMGERAGTTLVDSIGGFNGTLAGAFTLARPGGVFGDGDTAIEFDGKTGKADVPYNAALNPPQWSVGALAKRIKSNAANNPVADCRPASSGALAAGFDLFVNVDNGYGISVCSTNVAQTIIVAPTPWTTAAREVYHRVIATYDGTTVRIYLDGVLQTGAGQGPTVCPFTPNPNKDIGIGHLTTGANFAGVIIDELFVDDVAWSDADVATDWSKLINPRKAIALDVNTMRVASELGPRQSPASGNAIVPDGWVLMMGDEGEWDRLLIDARADPSAYVANASQLVVPYYSGGWPPDPLIGTPGHTPPTQ